MSSVVFDITENQAQKILRALRTGKDVSVSFRNGAIRLNDNLPNLIPQLTQKVVRASKGGKGLRVSLSEIKQGGILPLLIPALGPLLAGALTGGAALTKTIMDNKRKYRELDETRRHNEALERTGAGCSGGTPCPKCKGSGLYWTSRKGEGLYWTSQKGSGIKKRAERNQKNDTLTKDARQ